MRTERLFTLLQVLTLSVVLLSGCALLGSTDEGALTVTINADGSSLTMPVGAEATVSDALRQAGITPGELDRVNPPGFNRVFEGMTITVVRVNEETSVIEEAIPFERRTTLNDGLAPGESRLLQAGINGNAEITIRITYEDGVEVARNEIRRVLITSPQDEIVMVGSSSDLPTVTVPGTLAYIANGNAWVMTQNSANRRPLTLDGGLDGRVFELSDDGRRLIYTRAIDDSEPEPTLNEPLPEGSEPVPTPAQDAGGAEDFNTLWVVLDVDDPDSAPVRLDLNNILFADWLPGTTNTILYSTAEPRAGFPGWQANNDLWRAEAGANGATTNRLRLLEPSSGGVYGWFGTFYSISPDGVTVAWAQPDSIGVLLPVYEVEGETTASDGQPQAYARQTIASFAPRNPYDFVWVPGLSWSPDGLLIATTTHGAPLGVEAPEDSEVYNVTALPSQGGYSVDLIEQAGMWSSPHYSPLLAANDPTSNVMLAYLRAIDPLNSQLSRYQLVIIDRDGSNPRTVFPPDDQPGLLPTDQDYTWSPDGGQIALTYQGNLYLLDVESGVAQQLTSDGLTTSPRWMP